MPTDDKLDLSTTPLSSRGNWLCLSTPQRPAAQPLGPGLYLRSNHARGIARRELFLIGMLAGGRLVEAQIRAGFDGLTMSGPDGACIEIVMTSGEGVRIRGRGCALRLTAVPGENSIAYSPGEGCWVFNLRSSLRRYRCEVLAGTCRLDQEMAASESNFESGSMALTVEGAEASGFELAVDAFWSGWEPVPRPSFEAIREERRTGFTAFREALPPVPGEWSAAARLGAYILWSCTMSPCGQLRRETLFMSINWMDQVWSWDNVFNLCALARGHPGLAMDQMRAFADHQDAFGAYPDGLNDIFKHYNFSKPPVHGILLDWLSTMLPDFLNAERKAELYETLSAFAGFWLNHRTDAATGLPYYLHGNDSGQDNATLFDRGSPLITPDLGSYLSELMETLARWAGELGRTDEAAGWKSRAGEMRESLLTHLWQDDGFVAIKVDSRETVRTASVMTLKPLLLGTRLPDAVREACLAELEAFLTPHGLATERPDSDMYLPDGYWRGPMWAPTVMLFVIALQRCGRDDRAHDLATRFCRTCAHSGFAENFNALTGEPLRDGAYTWTPSVFFCLGWMLRKGAFSSVPARP